MPHGGIERSSPDFDPGAASKATISAIVTTANIERHFIAAAEGTKKKRATSRGDLSPAVFQQ
jgi:hypothetical protein